MDRIGHRQLSAIIETIYDASIGDDWQSVVDRMSAEFDQISVQLFGHDSLANKPDILLTANYSPEMLASYFAHYPAINPWLPAVVAAPPRVVMSHEQLFDP